MSTRHARVADKELNDKHTKILVDLLQKPENRKCADCKKKGKKTSGIYLFFRLETEVLNKILDGLLGTWVYSFALDAPAHTDL
jgi:hypothetical protein